MLRKVAMYYPKVLQRKYKMFKTEFYMVALILITLTCICVAMINYDYTKNHTSWISNVNRATWGCAIRTDNPYLQKYSQATKSATYIPKASAEENKEFIRTCFTSIWHVIHFVGHLIGGFLFPMWWFEILALTTAFELYEYFSCRCHDVSDVVYNTAGILLGVYLRQHTLPVAM